MLKVCLFHSPDSFAGLPNTIYRSSCGQQSVSGSTYFGKFPYKNTCTESDGNISGNFRSAFNTPVLSLVLFFPSINQIKLIN